MSSFVLKEIIWSCLIFIQIEFCGFRLVKLGNLAKIRLQLAPFGYLNVLSSFKPLFHGFASIAISVKSSSEMKFRKDFDLNVFLECLFLSDRNVEIIMAHFKLT